MPCNVLQPPSTLSSTPPTALPLLSLLLLLLLLHLLPPLVLILPLVPSLYSPLSFPCRGGVRSKFNFHRVTPLTYRPLFLSLSLSTPDSLPSFFLLSIRETLRTRERKPPAAFLAINYAAQLFTGISSCASV